jgi:hypothetical protein
VVFSMIFRGADTEITFSLPRTVRRHSTLKAVCHGLVE